ncbi:MAG: 16S rRNA (guanine(966)-N(2))-methyltransferase RsmD [Proteobacteria bacterium]|nr:16S rRNA (guanine(966)-N(2))-methyltransferase RsmD [Pseudomonadota bacterium]
MKNNNRIRIIGGEWRGRYITFPPFSNLRPTPNRVRETLFNWLGQTLRETTCVDLFAGSGALGFEAASRGAKKVVLVEKNSSICRSLRENIIKLNAEQVEIRNADALVFLNNGNKKFDLVFLDPPFKSEFHANIWQGIKRLVRPGSLIYVESNRRHDWPSVFKKKRFSQAGQVFYSLLEFESKS